MAKKKISCNLCSSLNDKYLIVRENKLAIAFLPISPLNKGHIMILPKRHVTLENLTSKESKAVSDILIRIKSKLKGLFPQEHPIIVTLTDTNHSSIQDHFHYHILPSKDNLRKIFSGYYNLDENKKLSKEELTKIAKKLR